MSWPLFWTIIGQALIATPVLALVIIVIRAALLAPIQKR